MKKSMKLRDVLREALTTDRSHRKIAQLSGSAHNTIRRYRKIAEKEGFSWQVLEKLDDSALSDIFQTKRGRKKTLRMPDYAYVHAEMAKKHQTLIQLWDEYRLADPSTAYCYSQFTLYYRDYRGKLDVTMRMTHAAGDKVFVDFAGTTVPWVDKDSKEQYAQIFVAVLGCSNYTFVYAVPSQKLPCWIACHNAMFHFLGGVPETLVPDNLKAAVTKAGREPVLNRTYLDMGRHFEITIIPARAYHPQDKAKAENGVLLISRWILAILRRRKFFSIDEINVAIVDLLKRFNDRPFKHLEGSRRMRFEKYDKPLLKPLPESLYEFARWIEPPRIDRDYHAMVDKHAYSIPYSLIGERVEARVTQRIVEIYHNSVRVAAHIRSHEAGGFTTDDAHRPKKHRAYAEQTRERFIQWAESTGPAVVAAIEAQFADKPEYSSRALTACTQLKDIARRYGAERFEAACIRAKAIESLSVKSIRSILECRLDMAEMQEAPIQAQLPFHHNVRGSNYYSGGTQHA